MCEDSDSVICFTVANWACLHNGMVWVEFQSQSSMFAVSSYYMYSLRPNKYWSFQKVSCFILMIDTDCIHVIGPLGYGGWLTNK